MVDRTVGIDIRKWALLPITSVLCAGREYTNPQLIFLAVVHAGCTNNNDRRAADLYNRFFI